MLEPYLKHFKLVRCWREKEPTNLTLLDSVTPSIQIYIRLKASVSLTKISDIKCNFCLRLTCLRKIMQPAEFFASQLFRLSASTINYISFKVQHTLTHRTRRQNCSKYALIFFSLSCFAFCLWTNGHKTRCLVPHFLWESTAWYNS